MEDLASVVMKGGGGGGKQESALRRRLKAGIGSAAEMAELVRQGIANSTERNDSFPALPDAIQLRITQMCTKEEYFSGQNIVSQREDDGTYYVLRRGRVDVIMDGERINGMEVGMGFGEIGLLLGTKRTATVKCVTPCEVYALDRADYDTALSFMPKDQRTGPLALALNKLWSLMTNPVDGSGRPMVDYKVYLASHIRTSKTLTSNSDAESFDEDEERAVAQEDWAEDCARYKMKVTESLSREQYFSSMYQLVELWSEDCNLSYDKFLTWLLENISAWDPKNDCFVFKAVSDVAAVGDKFEEMKEQARAAEEAERQAKEEALAAAEAKRREQAEREAEIRRQHEEAKQAAKVRMAEAGKMAETVKKLGGERAELNDRLKALEDEEAELLRRLASGELSPEEEAAVRARLEAIAAERAALQAQLLENQLKAEIAELDRRLLALDDEEAELMRRLAAGNLTPEEEAAIRKRLAEIAAEREALLAERAVKLAAQHGAAADAADKKFAAQLAEIDQKLKALDDEEAELRRRLAAGDLTPEEEAAIRARLAEIAAEREALLQARAAVVSARSAAQAAHRENQAAAEIAELKRKLAALDDEEAELRRRLEAGDLTPEEEAAIRKRLAEIEAERQALLGKLKGAEAAAELGGIDGKLAALDDEEAELLRRLAAGNLTPEEEAAIRKRLEEIERERRELLAVQAAGIDARLSALDDEEAELRRRLAAGNLSPEEEAAIRKRLGEIAAEREALLKQRAGAAAREAAAAQNRLQSEVDQLKRRLSALDDEEAELLRRLAAGDLSPEEEAAIRARLAEIAAERAALQAELHQAEIRAREAEIAGIDARLSALDDEEAELLRRLAAGDLTPEEEARIRARLAEIAAEREALLKQRAGAAAQLQAAEEAVEESRAAAEAAAAAVAAAGGSPAGAWTLSQTGWRPPTIEPVYSNAAPGAGRRGAGPGGRNPQRLTSSTTRALSKMQSRPSALATIEPVYTKGAPLPPLQKARKTNRGNGIDAPLNPRSYPPYDTDYWQEKKKMTRRRARRRDEAGGAVSAPPVLHDHQASRESLPAILRSQTSRGSLPPIRGGAIALEVTLPRGRLVRPRQARTRRRLPQL